jgi:6-phosphogluconate dehydrogenase
MMQAIGEGMHLLSSFHHEKIDANDVLGCWRNGSVVRSWLIDLMQERLKEDSAGSLENSPVPSHVEDTGEVNWLISDAIQMEVPIPVISSSIMQLFASRDQSKTWAKCIAMMRHGFGGHPYGHHAGIQEERSSGRVGDIQRQRPSPTLSD